MLRCLPALDTLSIAASMMAVVWGVSACQTQPVQVVPPPVTQMQRAVASPTGKLIFIHLQGHGSERTARIIECNVDGTNPRVLTRINGTIMSLSASPVDARIIYTMQAGRSYPVVVTLDRKTGQTVTISPTNTNNFSGVISPDGQQFLLSHSLTGNPEIFLLNAQGQRQLTRQTAIDVAPVWLPDGQSFLFTSDQHQFLYPQIYRYDIGSQQITRVTQTGKTNAMARVSPNGRFISFVANNDQGMLMALASNATIAINNEGLAEPANFSADGNYLVFSAKNQLKIVPVPKLKQGRFLPVQSSQTVTVAGVDMANATLREPIWVSH